MKPKRYRAHYIEPGIISYEDVGDGKVFVSKDALDKMSPSFVGAPVINEMHRDIGPEEAFNRRNENPEDWADGIISNAGYDAEKGWYYADMLIWDEETIANLDENDYSVSCAYIPSDVASGGSYHGIDYDEEVVNGEYTHMAIVDSPRYEGATVRENARKRREYAFVNSKAVEPIESGKEEVVNIKLFKSKKKENASSPLDAIAAKVGKGEELTPEEEKLWAVATDAARSAAGDDEGEEEMENMSGIVKLEDGTEIPLEELVQMYKQKKSENEGGEDRYMNETDTVDVDGEEMQVGELLQACGYGDKENSEDPTDETAEPVVDEAKQKQNAAEAKKKGKENMRKVRSAVQNSEGGGFTPDVETRSDRLNRGKERYSRKVAQGGKE